MWNFIVCCLMFAVVTCHVNSQSTFTPAAADDICDKIRLERLENELVELRRQLEEIRLSFQASKSNANNSCSTSNSTDTCSNQLVQQNVDGSNFFNRTWNEFKAGFGNISGNYWIGNELLHVLTQSGKYKLRFDLQSRDNLQWYWAEFSTFIVDSESDDYTLHVSGFTGTVVNSNFYGFEYHNGMKFTTKDRNNNIDGNCAVILGGGFWYNACSACNINTLEGNGNHFAWYRLTSSLVLLKTCRMSLVCV